MIKSANINRKRIATLASILFFILCFVSYSFASKPYIPKKVDPLTQHWRWKQFPFLEGKGVRHIYEGSNQKIWFSHNEGVYEYNGYDWKSHGLEEGLTSYPVDQVYESMDGLIYASTPGGIFSLRNNHWSQVFTTPENVPFTFTHLTQLRDGRIAACSNRGLLILSLNGRPEFYTSQDRYDSFGSEFKNVDMIVLPEKLKTDEDFQDVSNVLQDANHDIWIALTMTNENGRLIKFNPESISDNQIESYNIFSSNETIQLGESQKMLETDQNEIWVINSTYKAGISIYKNGKWRYEKISNYFNGDEYVSDIVQTKDGTIWIGALGKLYTYSKGQWKLYASPAFPIPSSSLILHKSSEDKIWIAGYKSKALLLDFSNNNWVSYNDLNYQSDDNQKNQWFIDRYGKAVKHDGMQWISYGLEDGLMDAPIRIISTSKGQLWASGSHNGIACTALFQNEQWIKTTHPQLSWGIDYRASFEDKKGDLWFGAAVDAEFGKGQSGGVLKLVNPTSKNKEWIHYASEENGLQQSNVYGIGQSVDGKVWIGGSSLFGLNEGNWQRAVDNRLQQFVNVVTSNDELLLVGSRYYGVFIFDGQNWVNYNTTNGLSNNTVFGIDALPDGKIYVATENDICLFDGEYWVSNVFPEELNMDFEGGMILHDLKGSIWINKSSRSWKRRAFPYNQINLSLDDEFIAYQYTPDTKAPQTEVSILSQEIDPSGNAIITWSGNDYLTQANAENLMYSWRLNNGDWSPYTIETSHTFMNLANGNYSFEVRSRDIDLNIDNTPSLVTFEVLPPVWKQLWFLLLVGAFLTTIGVFEYRVLTKRKKLEKANTSLSNANTQLQESSQKIQSQNKEILSQQEHIINQAKALEKTNINLEERNIEIEEHRKTLEDMIVQVEDLSKTKISFFTNISHELRTPLSLISGPIQELKEEGETLDWSKRQKLYKIIGRNSNRLLKLVDQLLELRRIEQTSLNLNYINVNLNNFVQEIVNMFENLAINKDILLHFDFNCDREEASLDADKIEKIIVNLISNSFKYTPEGGNISVSLNMVKGVDKNLSPLNDNYLELSVEDTGAGISKSDLEHIYERFYTVESKDAERHGTGIGLAYIKDLVQVLQGEIRVFSDEDQGTTFRVYIPFKTPEAIVDNNTIAGYAPFKIAKKEADNLMTVLNANVDGSKESAFTERILVVEDNPDMLLFIESVLSDSYSVLKAKNGVEGWNIAHKQSVDLIISDVMMPEMDGISFCKKIKSDVTTRHIPIILLTAKALDENIMEGYNEGADDYIPKPFNPTVLKSRVLNILDQRKKLLDAFHKNHILKPQKIEVTSPDDELLARIISIMEENLEDPEFNVNQMCKMVFLSHMHFIRKVKQLTGRKPIDLLKSFRLARAKDLLAATELNVAEIAYRVGYNLPNSFSRAFKQEYGISPTEFSEREKKGVL